MFRTACDNSVTTSQSARPPPANPIISKCPSASPIRTKPDRANPLPLPHHRAPAAHRNPSPQPFRHPHAPQPLRHRAVSFHSALSRLADLAPSTSVPCPRHGPLARSRDIPMPADHGDHDRVIVIRPAQPAAGLASHRPKINPPAPRQPHPNRARLGIPTVLLIGLSD